MKLRKILAAVLGCTMLLATGCSSTATTSSSSVASSSSAASSSSTASSSSSVASSASSSEAASSEAESTAELTGTVSLSGSTSMEEVVKALAEDFMNKNPGVTIDAQFNGSGQGITDATEGKADIGNSSRELKEEELAGGLTANVIAIDGIAVVVNPANPVNDLTIQQLADIYTGTIKNWSEVGGEDKPIVVVGRDAASGTRSAFEEILGVSDACAYAQEKDSTGAVKTAVETTPEAIGYVSLEAADADENTKKLMLDGAEATAENIVSGSYKLSRPFIMATKGELRPEVQAFLDYVLSEEGQAVVASQSLITVG